MQEAYIAAVETADGQALEPAIRTAYDQFIRGCKADGIWDAIKASLHSRWRTFALRRTGSAQWVPHRRTTTS
jgi:hypothetical protein